MCDECWEEEDIDDSDPDYYCEDCFILEPALEKNTDKGYADYLVLYENINDHIIKLACFDTLKKHMIACQFVPGGKCYEQVAKRAKEHGMGD